MTTPGNQALASGSVTDPGPSDLRRSLLCTLGPSSLRGSIIVKLEEAGVTDFRLNMSHTPLEELERDIQLIQQYSRRPLTIDTSGGQIRTGFMSHGVTLLEGGRVRLVPDDVRGDATTIPLTPGDVVGRLTPGARMSVDYDSALLRIDSVASDHADGTVLVGGEVRSRRSVTVLPSPSVPNISDMDRKAIELARRYGIRSFSLSFCDDAESVEELRRLAGPESVVVAKIETREGVQNLGEIARTADALLIDRGDLSRQVRLEAIPLLQKAIIREAKAVGTKVFVATNLLESMVTSRAPTRAEVNDVINTLMDGADGLVLAAETAVGKYPVEAARMVSALLREYRGSLNGYRTGDLLGRHPLAPD